MTIVLRADKGSALTIAEHDGNLTDLNDRLIAVETAEGAQPVIDSDVTGNVWSLTINGNTYIHTIPSAQYAPPPVIGESGITRILAAADAQTYIRCSNASGCAITINLNATTPIAVGAEVRIYAATEGEVSVAGATGGVTINPPVGCTLVLAGLGATVTLKKVGPDEWDAAGQFAATV